jgi:hypothetical protein
MSISAHTSATRPHHLHGSVPLPYSGNAHIHIDMSPDETADPHLIASELLRHRAGSDDELVTLYAGEHTAFMAGRLADLAVFAQRAPSARSWTRSFMTSPE